MEVKKKAVTLGKWPAGRPVPGRAVRAVRRRSGTAGTVKRITWSAGSTVWPVKMNRSLPLVSATLSGLLL